MNKLGVTLGSIAFALLLTFSFAVDAFAASSLYLSTPKAQVRTGERVTVNVRVGAPDQSINAVSGILLYPETLLKVISVSKEGSIINLWTREPSLGKGRIPFEGIVLNPGFQGAGGQIFRVTFEARRTGKANLSFIEGAVLANDGLGTNTVASLSPTSIAITEGLAAIPELPEFPDVPVETGGEPRILALPVITDYSAMIGPDGSAFVKGKGEPGALTKIVFKDISFRSIGEQFIASLQPEKKSLDEVFVKNNPDDGTFEYKSSTNLAAGAYNATPFLVDPQTQAEKPGLGVQLLVSDSQLVRALVVLVNVLALLIPIVGLAVLIYFIPWYSFRRMRVIKRRLGLEEERIALSKNEVQREDRVGEHATAQLITSIPSMITPQGTPGVAPVPVAVKQEIKTEVKKEIPAAPPSPVMPVPPAPLPPTPPPPQAPLPPPPAPVVQ